MPTPFNKLPPRDEWRELIAAGMTKLTGADGKPLLQVATPSEDPDKLLRLMRTNGERKMAGQPKENRYAPSTEPGQVQLVAKKKRGRRMERVAK